MGFIKVYRIKGQYRRWSWLPSDGVRLAAMYSSFRSYSYCYRPEMLPSGQPSRLLVDIVLSVICRHPDCVRIASESNALFKVIIDLWVTSMFIRIRWGTYLPIAGFSCFKLTNQTLVTFMVIAQQAIVKMLCYYNVTVGIICVFVFIICLFGEHTQAPTRCTLS